MLKYAFFRWEVQEDVLPQLLDGGTAKPLFWFFHLLLQMILQPPVKDGKKYHRILRRDGHGGHSRVPLREELFPGLGDQSLTGVPFAIEVTAYFTHSHIKSENEQANVGGQKSTRESLFSPVWPKVTECLLWGE